MKIKKSISLFILSTTLSPVFADGVFQVETPGYSVMSAEYTTSHVYIDEVAGTTVPIRFTFDPPGTGTVYEVEVFTNLNRRDLARTDKNMDGVPDGIVPIDGNTITSSAADTDPVTGHYYAAFPMTYNAGADKYELTINAAKTGAYRVTARYRTTQGGAWTWYGLRDHCVVVSPTDARSISLYEVNVFNIEADGDQFANRSTLEDLYVAPGALPDSNNRWDLDYLKNLGCNWLWFQPIHPIGIDGREPEGGYGSGTPPYDPGSPYAVKNFFAVNELMTENYDGSKTLAENRAAAMTAWNYFVAAADEKGVGVMLDAPFNHTAYDVELAQQGVNLFQPDGATWLPTDEIRNRESRFFSRDYDAANNPGGENYGDRATNAGDIAPGPDRFDFGKWQDVKDVYFGRYDALVEYDDGGAEKNSYKNEGDWFDFSDGEWTSADFTQGGTDFNVTRRVWDYFAEYALHWLEQTRPPGKNRNSTPADGDAATRYAWDRAGIDGLRCDFGQGLPPRAWEYMINVARGKKWNFVMMAESLDGGEVTYRSARHFDILNENIVFPLKSAANKYSYRDIFDNRRNAYGQALVLMNTASHDEENYDDPWQAVVRIAVTATNDGLTMVFPGQELGISRTFGYQHYETNFGKEIAHFKRWNSMMPIWNDTNYGNDQLYPVLSGMLTARLGSPALQSSNRWFLDGDGNNDQIHAVAKYETPNESPATSDVVIAFSNLDRNNTQSDNFKIPSALFGLLGLQDGRLYNVKNIAAYTAQQSNRRDLWLWGGGITGSNLKSSGFYVQLNKVPTSDADWSTAPYEAQYLKVYDVTAPTATPGQPDMPNVFAYAIGTDVVFDWADVPPDAAGVVPSYEVSVTVNGNVTGKYITTESTYTATGAIGDQISITVKAVNPDETNNQGPASVASHTVKLLDPTADEDGDGQNNAKEKDAGTNPLDQSSVFKTTSVTADGNDFEVEFTTVPDRYYHLETTIDLGADDPWMVVNGNNLSAGSMMTLVHTGGGSDPCRFYRVRVTETPE
jgi:glycosidase